MATAACWEDSRTACMAAVACSAAPTPSLATSAASVTAAAVSCAAAADSPTPAETSVIIWRVLSTECSWRSAPAAMFEMALAISPTARPVSSEVAAICCDAEATVVAEPATALSVWRRLSDMRRSAWPSASASLRGVISCVRSPAAMRSAVSVASWR